MYRASSLLKASRLEKQLELEEISQKIKIPLKHLQAIESENINAFPQEPYCSLIVKDYANFLGLNSQEILGFFRRDFAQKHKNKNTQNSRFSFTPRFTFFLAVIGSIMAFSFYLVSEYLQFNRPPSLSVKWPESESIGTTLLEISGNTDPESTVKINDNLIIVSPDGSFVKNLYLIKGDNPVTVESQSPSGKSTTSHKIIKVLY